MKLSDYKNEEAIELIADILEPFQKIFSDKRVKTAYQKGRKDGSMMPAITTALKHHSKEVLTILARIDGVPLEEYEISAIVLPAKVMELLNDPQLTALFPSAEPNGESKLSGSATENIEESEE